MKDLWTPRLWIPSAAPVSDRLVRDLLGAGWLLPPTKNPGDALTSALWNTYIRDNLDFGMVRPIADVTAGGATASFDLTSIPQTFAHLLAVMNLGSDSTTADLDVIARINNISTATYLWNGIKVLSAGVTYPSSGGGTSATIGLTSPNAGQTMHGPTMMLIPHYTAAGNKPQFLSLGGGNGFGQNIAFYAGSNQGAAATSRLTILPSAGNFRAGSRVTLYGMGGI